jgi:hypothetical protein
MDALPSGPCRREPALVRPGGQVGLVYSRPYVWAQMAFAKDRGEAAGVDGPLALGMESVQGLEVLHACDDHGGWDPEGDWSSATGYGHPIR